MRSALRINDRLGSFFSFFEKQFAIIFHDRIAWNRFIDETIGSNNDIIPYCHIIKNGYITPHPTVVSDFD